jgi:hypothetical protein
MSVRSMNLRNAEDDSGRNGANSICVNASQL